MLSPARELSETRQPGNASPPGLEDSVHRGLLLIRPQSQGAAGVYWNSQHETFE